MPARSRTISIYVRPGPRKRSLYDRSAACRRDAIGRGQSSSVSNHLTQIGGHPTLETLQHILLALSAVILLLWFVYVALIIKESSAVDEATRTADVDSAGAIFGPDLSYTSFHNV